MLPARPAATRSSTNSCARFAWRLSWARSTADIAAPTVEVIAPENQGEMIDLLKQSGVRIKGSLNPHREGRPYLPLIRPAA